MKTKTATELVCGDRVYDPATKDSAIIIHNGITSRHAPGRIGFLARRDNNTVVRLSLLKDQEVQIIS